jgi:hypothetical protein
MKPGALAALQRRDIVLIDEGEHMARANFGGALGDQRHGGRHDAEPGTVGQFTKLKNLSFHAAKSRAENGSLTDGRR